MSRRGSYLFSVREPLQTFFVTIITADRRRLLQSDRCAVLLREILFHYRDEKRYALHPFVIMPDHLHLLVTPSWEQSLERCVQCIKGGFSHAMRVKTGYAGPLWQRSFHEHRIRDREDYRAHCAYIAGNARTPDYEYLELEGPSLDRPPVGLSG